VRSIARRVPNDASLAGSLAREDGLELRRAVRRDPSPASLDAADGAAKGAP